MSTSEPQPEFPDNPATETSPEREFAAHVTHVKRNSFLSSHYARRRADWAARRALEAAAMKSEELRLGHPRRLLWANPVLRKELRATSRRRRYYALRFAFLLALTAFVAAAWQAEAGTSQIDNILMPGYVHMPDVGFLMSEIGKSVVRQVTWFVFIAAQGVMVILCGTAVSGEITARTLPVLLSTPMSYVQIVWGKLLGRLSHVMTLVLCAMPPLMLARVFGGVPWSFIINTSLLTIAASLLVGAIAIFESVKSRKPGGAMFATFITLAKFYGIALGLTLMTDGAIRQFLPGDAPNLFFFLTSPHYGMIVCDKLLMTPTSIDWNWLAVPTLAVMVVAAGWFMRRACLRIRALVYESPTTDVQRRPHAVDNDLTIIAALRRMRGTGRGAGVPPAHPEGVSPSPGGETGLTSSNDQANGTHHAGETPAPRQAPAPRRASASLFSPVGPRPVFWRETHKPLVKGMLPFILMFAMVLCGAVYAVTFLSTCDDPRTTPHIVVVEALLLAGLLLSLVLAASTLATQRQARTLGVLLTTPISPWTLVRDTVLAIYWRGRFVWMLLLLHLAVFCLLGHLHPMVIPHVLMIAAGSSLLTIGLGLFISSRVRSPMLSILTTLAVLGLVWGIVPATSTRALTALKSIVDIPMVSVHYAVQQSNPFRHAGVVVLGAPGPANRDYGKFGALTNLAATFHSDRKAGDTIDTYNPPPTLVYSWLTVPYFGASRYYNAEQVTVRLAVITAIFTTLAATGLLLTGRRVRKLA